MNPWLKFTNSINYAPPFINAILGITAAVFVLLLTVAFNKLEVKV